ncbi:MAG: heparinase II/III family protein [Gemmatimonadaceae bacterium]|nr:heparinase II/III family protein [Gemmatimonadaceae bacterium]
MSLFLDHRALCGRREFLRDPDALGGLAGSLQRELHAALDVPVPAGKSRLTRQGGRCARCTVLLAFDPRRPFAHACPQCGTVYDDRVHHEWWLMNAHLWTAEQCTRAAALAFLRDDDLAARRADAILEAYTARYLQWPNRDNALGPTRPFFSTYLESIWLLHLAIALDLRMAAAGGATALHAAALDRLVAPSSALIASFDEGRSNRQVWHAAALLASAHLLDDAAMRDRAGASVVALIREGLHDDGSWYEGENYHLFAHRGLLSGVTLAERAGIGVPAGLLERFERGFAVPFRTMLPDGTFPARRDSQYGVALRQYRTADWVECGLARRDTPPLRAALAMLYADWPSPGDTGRAHSTADAERNQPGLRLTRADCGWRALLLAVPALPPLEDAALRSELLEGQGLAVFRRRAGAFWVGLDYGDPGDGHGHPDRLNVVIATRQSRWLDDVGTGSYTSPTLAWYRSSLAHNAPMVDGCDQGEAHGTLLAHDEQADAGWVSAEFTDPRSAVTFVRTLVVLDGYVIDELTWTSARDVVVDVPMQAQRIADPRITWAAAPSHRTEWLVDPQQAALPAGTHSSLVLRGLPSPAGGPADPGALTFTCSIWSATDALLWSAGTIGPPAGSAHGLVALRQSGRAGRSLRVFASPGAIADVGVDDGAITVTCADQSVTTHRRTATGWRISTSRNSVTVHEFSCELGGVRDRPAAPARATRTAGESVAVVRTSRQNVVAITLGEAQYRQTEVPWHLAGQPTAQVFVTGLQAGMLIITVAAQFNRPPHFAPARDENPLDNELSDVNSDGVQLHWRSLVDGITWNGALAVPAGDMVRLTAVHGNLDGLEAAWSLEGSTVQVVFSLPCPPSAPEFSFCVCVNDCPPGRERRRGQLVLGGREGETAYLRGARQPPDRAVRVLFEPEHP